MKKGKMILMNNKRLGVKMHFLCVGEYHLIKLS